jgi:hypothetical protein
MSTSQDPNRRTCRAGTAFVVVLRSTVGEPGSLPTRVLNDDTLQQPDGLIAAARGLARLSTAEGAHGTDPMSTSVVAVVHDDGVMHGGFRAMMEGDDTRTPSGTAGAPAGRFLDEGVFP